MEPYIQEKDQSVIIKVTIKIIKLFSRGYIMEGVILTLLSLLSVTKGT